MIDYQIAIPSYDRAEVCQTKTLATLREMGVDADRVTVFVADEAEKEIYDQQFNGDWRTVVAELGIFKARRFINAHYAEGTRILSIDDDMKGFIEKRGKSTQPYLGTITDLAQEGFAHCEAAAGKLWGIHPTENGFFMKDYTVVGLRYIGAGMFGSYAGDPVFLGRRPQQSSGEDFETSLRSFLMYGKVVRLEYLGWSTANFAKGGIDSELQTYGITDRANDHTRALIDIASRFPELAKTYKKSGNVTNLRLKSITLAKIPRHAGAVVL